MQPTFVPVPPITLLETVDLDVFADVASAVHDMDLDDVRKGRSAFDSVGRPLRVVSNGDWPVDLVVAEDCEAAPGELEIRLRSAIRRLGADWVGLAEFESAPLATLLDTVLRFQTGVPYESPPVRLLRLPKCRGRVESRPAND